MFKILYLLSPLVSVVLAAKGYPAIYIAVGIACSLVFILFDTFVIAGRMFALTGSSRATGGFVGRMMGPLIGMIIPATIWNAVGYGLGWMISLFVH